MAEEDTPVAVARINLRASILRRTAATAAVAAVVVVAAVAVVVVAAAAVDVVVVVAVAAAAADVGIAFAATSRCSFQLAVAEHQLVVAGYGVESVGREGLGGNCWGR
jgi:hypothetical protein